MPSVNFQVIADDEDIRLRLGAALADADVVFAYETFWPWSVTPVESLSTPVTVAPALVRRIVCRLQPIDTTAERSIEFVERNLGSLWVVLADPPDGYVGEVRIFGGSADEATFKVWRKAVNRLRRQVGRDAWIWVKEHGEWWPTRYSWMPSALESSARDAAMNIAGLPLILGETDPPAADRATTRPPVHPPR